MGHKREVRHSHAFSHDDQLAHPRQLAQGIQQSGVGGHIVEAAQPGQLLQVGQAAHRGGPAFRLSHRLSLIAHIGSHTVIEDVEGIQSLHIFRIEGPFRLVQQYPQVGLQGGIGKGQGLGLAEDHRSAAHRQGSRRHACDHFSFHRGKQSGLDRRTGGGA